MPKVRFLAKAAFVTGFSFLLPSDIVSAQDRGQLFSLLSTRDPLSCAVHGTSTDLCAGPAGAWQIGRLALSVEATAKALELAGIGFDSRDVQAMIYRDGASSGFDLALVTPTIAMIDFAALGPSGPFGENAEAIGSLSTLALESLYPGIVAHLGFGEIAGLPGVEPNGGFSGFPDFAASFGGIQPGQAQSIEFDKFLPVRHPALSSSAPILQLIPSTIGTSGSTAQVVGGSPNDFLFSHHANSDSPMLNKDGLFAGLPVSMAYKDYLAHEYGSERGEAPATNLFENSPFGGTACLICTSDGTLTAPGMPFADQLTEPSAPRKSADQLSGGQMLDSASSNIQASNPNDTEDESIGGRIGACWSTCPPEAKSDVRTGTRDIGIGVATIGVSVVTPAPVAAKALGIVGGVVVAADGYARYTKGVEACLESCGSDNDPEPTPVDEPDPEDSKDPGGPNDTDDPKDQDPEHEGGNTSADDQSSSAGETEMSVRDDQDPPLTDDPNGGPSFPQQGPEGCSPDQYLSVTFCTDPIYGPSEYSCFADERGEIGCFGPNVLVRSVAPEGPLFTMYQNGNQNRMLRLDNVHQDILSGDLVQASLIAALDHERFSMNEFVPMHDGGSPLRPINEILQHQSKDFFESGFGNKIGIGINPDGDTDLYDLGPVTVGIEGGSVRFGDGFLDTLPPAQRQ